MLNKHVLICQLYSIKTIVDIKEMHELILSGISWNFHYENDFEKNSNFVLSIIKPNFVFKTKIRISEFRLTSLVYTLDIYIAPFVQGREALSCFNVMYLDLNQNTALANSLHVTNQEPVLHTFVLDSHTSDVWIKQPHCCVLLLDIICRCWMLW